MVQNLIRNKEYNLIFSFYTKGYVNLENKVAFITGGCTGIGKAIACEFAKQGYDIAVSYHSSETCPNEIKELGRKVIAIKADISDYSQINNMFDEFKKNFDRLDVFINNAGITKTAPFFGYKRRNV